MAYAKKDTFWNKQRVEKGLTLKEISELVGEKEKTVSAYFTGFCMPSESTIRTLCDLFDVDFHTGSLEFQHAHKQYKAEHDLSLKYSSKKKSKKKDITSDEDILDALYGVLPRKEFLDVYKALYIAVDDSIDYRRILYNAVDYDTYCKINQVIEESRVEF
jgi:transcriptional regulator with XRE-family HTH domain